MSVGMRMACAGAVDSVDTGLWQLIVFCCIVFGSLACYLYHTREYYNQCNAAAELDKKTTGMADAESAEGQLPADDDDEETEG